MSKDVAHGHRVPDEDWPKVVADAEKFRLEAEQEGESDGSSGS